MAINEADVNLKKFLAKVTYTSDSSPGSKLVISDGEFLLVASLLKLNNTIKGKVK